MVAGRAIMGTEHAGGDTSGPGANARKREMPLAVGRIGAPHGIRGEVAVDVRTDDPETRFAPGTVLTTEPADLGPLTVVGSRWHGSRLLVRFAEARDRSAAERLRETLLLVRSAYLSPSPLADEFHDYELIDLPVRTADVRHVGVVVDVLHPPGQDLLVVSLPAGEEALVPFVAAIVHEVDRTGGIVIDPPPGLFDTDVGV